MLLTTKLKKSHWITFTDLIKNGKNNEACTFFINELKKPVLGTLIRDYAFKKADANSLLHDAFLEIQHKILSGKIEQVNKSFAFSYCINLGKNLSRKKATYHKHLKKLKLEQQNSAMDYVSIQLYPSNHEIEESKILKVIRAFEKMGEKCKLIIELKHIKGLNHNEIVNVMEPISSEEVSRTVLRRSMKK